MSERSVRRTARAIRAAADRRAEAAPRAEYALVTRASPLTAVMTERSVTLHEDDLVLGGAEAPDEGDTLVVFPMANGDWAVVQVVAEASSSVTARDLTVEGDVGFYGAAPAARPTVTGSRGGNAALASLLTALEDLGLIVDSST